jgi:hypothetical protein
VIPILSLRTLRLLLPRPFSIRTAPDPHTVLSGCGRFSPDIPEQAQALQVLLVRLLCPEAVQRRVFLLEGRRLVLLHESIAVLRQDAAWLVRLIS